METAKSNLKSSKVEYTKSFSQEQQLESYLNRQSELDKLLGFGEDDEIEDMDQQETLEDQEMAM